MERFWSKVNKTPGQGPKGECWEWTASKNEQGYGTFKLDGKLQKSHRVALGLHLGRPVRLDLYACHTCDNPPCCNPRHLYEGTPKRNAQDAAERDRYRNRKGEANDNAKLSDQQIAEMRRLAAAGGITNVAIGELFSVTKSYVGKVVREINRKVSL